MCKWAEPLGVRLNCYKAKRTATDFDLSWQGRHLIYCAWYASRITSPGFGRGPCCSSSSFLCLFVLFVWPSFVLPWINTIKTKSINPKLFNTGLQGSPPTDCETHLVLVTFYNAWTGTVFEDRHNDSRLIMMYQIVNENILIIKRDRHKPPLIQSENIHSSSFIIPPCKTQQTNIRFSCVRYLSGTGCHNPLLWVTSLKYSKMLHHLSNTNSWNL